MRIYIYIHMCIYVCICMYTYIHACIYVYMYECMHVCMYTYLSIYVYACMYIHMCVYICVYIYIYILPRRCSTGVLQHILRYRSAVYRNPIYHIICRIMTRKHGTSNIRNLTYSYNAARITRRPYQRRYHRHRHQTTAAKTNGYLSKGGAVGGGCSGWG